MHHHILFKNLVFSGGSSAAYAYAGAIEQLSNEPDFSFADIESVAGSSAGALAALLVSLNYTPDEMIAKFQSIDFNKLQDGDNYFSEAYRFYQRGGLYKGKVLYQLIKNVIKEKTGNENATFGELKKLGYKNLYIVTTKTYLLNDHVPSSSEKIFCAEKHANTSVADAVLSSVAHPLIFASVLLKKISKGTYIIDNQGFQFADGGIMNDFPIHLFDTIDGQARITKKARGLPQVINSQTLGLVLVPIDQLLDVTHQSFKTPIKPGHPIQYFTAVLRGLGGKWANQNLMHEHDIERSILINNEKVNSAKGLFITEAQKELLYQSGQAATQKYFSDLHHQIMNDSVNEQLVKPTPSTSTTDNKNDLCQSCRII